MDGFGECQQVVNEIFHPAYALVNDRCILLCLRMIAEVPSH